MGFCLCHSVLPCPLFAEKTTSWKHQNFIKQPEIWRLHATQFPHPEKMARSHWEFVPIFKSQIHNSNSNATSLAGKESHPVLLNCSLVFQFTRRPTPSPPPHSAERATGNEM